MEQLDPNRLANQYANITIQDEEDGGLDYENDEEVMGKVAQYQWALVGRFLTKKHINENLMMNTLASIWRPVKGVTVNAVPRDESDQNSSQLFLFQFYHERDMRRVLDGGPWTFESHVLVCQQIGMGERPESLQLSRIGIWIQIHDLPIGFMSERIGRDVGNFIGTYVVSDPNNFHGGWRSYMRIRVMLDIYKPLKRRMRLKKPGGEWLWINFKYERLPTFCFYCGLIGHNENYCEALFDNPEAGDERAYGVWLRAQGKKQSNIGAQWLRSAADGLPTTTMREQNSTVMKVDSVTKMRGGMEKDSGEVSGKIVGNDEMMVEVNHGKSTKSGIIIKEISQQGSEVNDELVIIEQKRRRTEGVANLGTEIQTLGVGPVGNYMPSEYSPIQESSSQQKNVLEVGPGCQAHLQP